MTKLVRTWYRSLTPDGELWCESSDPEEVKEQTHPTEQLTYQFFNVYEIEIGWLPWQVDNG